MKIRTLIVDDEPLVRLGLRRLLERHAQFELIGECGDGRSAVEAVARLEPELLLLDVRMPGLDGFEVLEALTGERLPHVIFVTAHEEFAVRAFDVHAVDYLLKPFARDRFEETLRRFRQRFVAERTTLTSEALDELAGSRRPVSRFLVRTAGRVRFVALEEIEWFESADNYVRLHTAERDHLVRRTMQSLERDLDPRQFVRIHRRAIVRIERIAGVRTLPGGDYVVTLADGSEQPVGRHYRRRFREAVALERD